ncbi:MAG TPA: glycosyltransferase, partial [Lacunisphaera sp.]|nr:glycosyltransferase [Lacunisphaera sp.]
MRTLFLTGSRASYMAPPQLADEQIVAGPEWPDAKTPEGRWISLRTPVGEYDLATVLARIPSDQRPDAVVSLVDASWRNQPRNVADFHGPKALLIADTHHLNSPLIGMFKYAASESYDRIVFLYDRHHLAFFESAGFRNLYWFPGLTLPHEDAVVRAARAKKREKRIAFVGQAGKFHPQRARLLAALKARGLPLDQRPLSQREALGFYGSSLVGFNASLNGDLNLRVFEMLATGAALLTDRLASESGLLELFAPGRELLTYDSAGELAERAAHALAHPDETAAIGAAGAAWFDTHFNASRRRAAFQELLLNGTAVPEFARTSPSGSRVYFGGDTTQLLQTMMVYEGMQELHRTEENVRVVITPTSNDDLADICATLPRVEVIRGEIS